ncbi:hypothetical protein MMC07_004663 [Pseudocyphellaria aurata]|nr:hypothetical protein [Pseudocyphellaria aurata]
MAGTRDASVTHYCPSCSQLTTQQRRAQTKRISDRALKQKRAAEKKSGQSQQAESSAAAGAIARHLPGADPSDETVHASGSVQHGPDPQLASSPAPAPGSSSDHLSPFPHHDEETASLSPGYRYPTPPPGFLPGIDNSILHHAGALSRPPAPEFPGFPPVHEGSTPSQETAIAQQVPIDPLLLHMDVLRAHGIELEDRQAAERLLRHMGLWPGYLL